jgi:isopenicillin-N N-acyltransferase-like protein
MRAHTAQFPSRGPHTTVANNMTFPRIRVSGGARARSEQYGRLARLQIEHVREGYERAFAAKGVTWEAATEQARAYLPMIEAHCPDLLEEIRGIAFGSGLSFDEILTINCRSEVLHAATVRRERGLLQDRESTVGGSRGECSSFALEPDRSPTLHSLVGQNWDWLETLGPGTIVLEVERDDGPNYVTIVEAGLLAKMTMNAHGVAMGINTLATTLDGTDRGLPFHFLIRRLADATDLSAALEGLAVVPRATSGSYMLASATGAVLNLETSPGGSRNITPQLSHTGAIVHTNHFIDDVPGGYDLAKFSMSDSYVRLGRLGRSVGAHSVGSDAAQRLSHEDLRAALSDHADSPNSICCHPDPLADPLSRWKTLASVIMDPHSRTMWLAEGPPCESEWVTADYSDFLARTPGH